MSSLFPVDPSNPVAEVLDRAAAALREGGIIAYPTETLYGLGVDALSEEALARLCRLKGRPTTMPISVLVRDLAMLKEVVQEIGPMALRLIEAFLPGPLTLILPARPGLPRALTAGKGTVGVRISAHPLVEHLFTRYPGPITTTSANLAGQPDARDAREVLSYFPQGIACILDAGPLARCVASTVVDVTGSKPVILREGAISRHRILAALNEKTP